ALPSETLRPGSVHAGLPRRGCGHVLQPAADAACRGTGTAAASLSRHLPRRLGLVRVPRRPGAARPTEGPRHRRGQPARERQVAASAGGTAVPAGGDARDPPCAPRHTARHLRHGRTSPGTAGCGTIRRSGTPRHLHRPDRQRARRALLRRRGPVRPPVAARGAADRRGRSARLRHAGDLFRQSRRSRTERRLWRRRPGGAEGKRRRARRSDRPRAERTPPHRRRDAADDRAPLPRRRRRAAVLGRLRRRDCPMIGAIGRAAAAAVLAALFGAVWSALLYAWRPAITVEFDRDYPKNLTGLYPPERDEPTGLTFAWTGPDVTLRLPGLDRRADWTLDLRVRGARAIEAENPDLVVTADGLAVSTRHTTRDFSDLRVTIPARGERRGLVLGLQASATFVPGPTDPRALGAMVDRLTLAPDRPPLVPHAAMTSAALASAAMGAALALLGVTAGSAIGGAVLLSAALAAMLARGFGPFTEYPQQVTALAAWIALALAALALAVQSWRGQPLRN